MSEQMQNERDRREAELQLKGLIYVRALLAAGGAPAEELRRFSAEIRRQRDRLEGGSEQTGSRALPPERRGLLTPLSGSFQ